MVHSLWCFRKNIPWEPIFQTKRSKPQKILNQRSYDSYQELPNFIHDIQRAIAVVTPSELPHPCRTRYVHLMDTKCATSQAEMCAAEWSIWARRCDTAPDKEPKSYIPRPSDQPPCPAAHGLSRCHPGCSEAPPQSPSLHSENRAVWLTTGASPGQQQYWESEQLTFNSNSEIFCFNSATYWECSASLILAIMRFSFI